MKHLAVLFLCLALCLISGCKKSYTCQFDDRSQTLACVEKTYRTVKAGGHIWLAENLNRVDIVGGSSFCYGDNPKNCSKYGSLYPFETALKICPEGWMLPTQAHFEAAKPKFDDLDIQMNGFRYYDGKSVDLGVSASFWTADEFDDARAVLVRVTDTTVYEHFNKSIAASVRCILK